MKKPRLQKCLHVSHAGRARTAMTCDLPKNHAGWHKAGYVSWPNDEGPRVANPGPS